MARALAAPHYLANTRRRLSKEKKNDCKNAPPPYSPAVSLTFRNGPCEKGVMRIEERTGEKAIDDNYLAPWKKTAFRLLPVTSMLYLLLITSTTYLQVRILRQQRATGNLTWTSLLTNYMIMGVQLSFSIMDIMHAISRGIAAFGRWRPRLELIGDNVPSVDILVPCCNEDVDVIMDTTKAALHLDYPKHRYRVLVTDDGNSQELARRVEQLAMEEPNLYYTARKKKGPTDFKAGNLNHALSFLSALPQGPAEYVASLDADMIPIKSWLRALLPHLIQDPRLAVVCPPQHVYNAPVNDPLCQTNRFFSRSVEVLKDMTGAAWNTGSGWVTRREALDSIGGWPTDSITEDAYCSTMLLAAGWKAAFVPEEVQHGLLPDSYFKHVKQRTRWNVGGAQRSVNMGLFLRKSWARKFTMGHRFWHIVYAMDYFTPLLFFFGIVSTPVLLFVVPHSGFFDNIWQLQLLLRLKCMVMLAGWLLDIHTGIFTGYQLCVAEQGNRVWMAPYYMITIVRSFFLPSWLGGKVTGFTATGSVADTLHERRADLRASLGQRLKHILIDCGAIFHLAIAILCSIGVGMKFQHSFESYGHDQYQLWLHLLSTIALPLPFWFTLITGCLIPTIYAIFPPSVPERESCLDRDPVTGVAYPKKEHKSPPFTMKSPNYAHLHFLTVIYAMTLFIGTWWI